ncbi:4Fe-4S binding protein [Bacteroides zoogleoformans]|uniref:Ferredoxin n=1 Tax=Bacteroides zoogleoformans TaxID=28119 RepID=A0ABM6T5P4_9BACE|nr:4Fe-4S binding protein [Bacteroides zoogleoformans]AVM51904.1 ferredoxin [Bacteroides zoogleoformans]TWJ17007.1 4Fe-4S binding protein [Bacteroides zoogleoformans]
MLRKIRLTFAMIFFALITLLFLDFTGTVHGWFGWLAKIQFLPAILALNVGVILLLVILTWVCGRIYCSVICPLGVLQDVMAWLGRKIPKRKKLPYSYSPALSWLRYGVLGVFVAALATGIGSFVALLAPYSSYGRIANNLLQPVWQWANNGLAYLAERTDSYAFYETEVWIKSLPTLLIASATFVSLIILAVRNGRTYCNTICPVGTILGFLSRYSLFRITIDPEKCNKCSLCSRRCKAACIDFKSYRIDYSRCVTCMDCIDTCKHAAISYKYHPIGSYHAVENQKGESMAVTASSAPKASSDDTDNTRRSFFTATALVAATSLVKAQEKKVDGGLATIEDKATPHRNTPITPPGSLSAHNMAQHCTACQLCVSICPNQVLHPSTDLLKLMQPEMSYEHGYCRPECTRCSEVCPAGAILPITRADKSSVQIGHAVWIKKNCIPLTDGVECGNCARHCPAGAIQMVPNVPEDKNSTKIPVINVERCIGCGACENLCPARPFTAIYVEGHERHRIV